VSTPLIVGALAAAYLLLFVLERAVPLRRPKARLLPRVGVNLLISAAALLAVLAVVEPVSAGTLQWATSSSFGLMHLAGLPGAVELVLVFLLLDLSFYYWHVANHRFALLWRIHNVHHIDPDLDVTTAFRFHFLEVALSSGFRAAQILLIGPSLAAYAVYELFFQLGTLFHHSNLRLPIGLERLLNKVLVTPRMHGIHHSRIRDETNSNFGVVFPWWDRIHGTLQLNVPQASIVIGIPGYSRPEDNRPTHCFALPFRPQRDYWSAAGIAVGDRSPPIEPPGRLSQ
jgi:sterol desaturase/sphingolipid hydroxylase (fatty acid hydroxylase superfamily)